MDGTPQKGGSMEATHGIHTIIGGTATLSAAKRQRPGLPRQRVVVVLGFSNQMHRHLMPSPEAAKVLQAEVVTEPAHST